MNEDYELFDRNTQTFVFGMQIKAIQRMLDFDYLIKRDILSVVGIINPGKSGNQKFFFGSNEILIPIYPSTKEACKKHKKVDTMISFSSFRSAYKTTLESFEEKTLKTFVIIAEGIPERRTLELIEIAKKKKKNIIGPATVGGVTAGAFKIGNAGGTIENIISCKLYRPGVVGFVSKSGGLSNEMYSVIAQNADGIYEGVAIGGDRYPGSTLFDHAIRYEKNPKVKMIVVLGEIGGKDEHEIAESIKSGKIKKPVVAWVTGTCAKLLGEGVQFGHAGAKAGDDDETADAKNEMLKKAGAIVPESFDDFDKLIKKTYESLGIKKAKEVEINTVPEDIATLIKDGKVRKSTHFVSNVCDDRGEEAKYLGTPISEAVSKFSLGETISLLWFQEKLPKFATEYIEMVLKTVADHGPAVSGAHNSIVTARAGKDLVSSLCSGLLTIGPRFGGAIDGAGKYFREAYEKNMSPMEFVKDMKSKNINIPGIGHKIKNIKNPDKRVVTLKKFVMKNFKTKNYLDFAMEVEKITTSKKDNLILNVDGFVAVSFIDLFVNIGKTKEEIATLVDAGILNAFFVLGRSIGFIAHILDQKKRKEGLYRHPWDDILYL